MTTETRTDDGAEVGTVATRPERIGGVRVCIVYDCLYPYTIGGAERWYRNLAERLAAAGHEVTILTRRQWPRGAEPALPGVRVVAVVPAMGLYTSGGRRRLLPPVVFGTGVLAHLLRHGARYDVVHTASFPYFSVLAAARARKRGGYRMVVDWHEVWTRAYWRDYLGPLGGAIGRRVQRLCARVPQQTFCFSRLHERRLRELGVNGPVTRIEGQWVGATTSGPPVPARPVVVFAGRLIPEKRAESLVPAVAAARERIPDLGAEIYGDGPERVNVLRAISEHGLANWVTAPGFVDAAVLEQAQATALCLALPSSREGYGLVVLEAMSRGVPVVVVDGPDNAATELVEEEVNGIVAASAEPGALADAIVAIHAGGAAMRDSTARWFRANARRLSLERSLTTVLEAYDA
jgi:glycosyltransferase involved in cell wall biosynthesis